jgi:hypothetical protein
LQQITGLSRVSNDFATFEDNWRESVGNIQASTLELKLGPGQRRPRNYHQNSPKYGEIFLEFHTKKSVLELRVKVIKKCNLNFIF